MKRIAFNALGLKSSTGGVESHIYNVVKHILVQDTKNQYFLYVAKNTEKVFDDLKSISNLKIIVFPINSNNSTIRVIAEHTLLALSLLKNRINLVHHFCNYMPRISPIKSVTTLHDLSGLFYHENFPPTKQMERYYNYLKKEVMYTLKHAEKVIVISEFTRSEVHKYYKNIDDNKLITIGMSLDTRKETFSADKSFLSKYEITEPYLLSVSVVRPHKNYTSLVKGFNKLKKEYNIPHQLVIAGGIQINDENFFREIEQSPYKEDIKYLGYVPNKELASLYTFAELYVTTTVYEGFGMPLLEAMAYEKPIACSNVASLPEVGGKGCVYFNPYDENDIAEVVNKLLNDNVLKQELVNAQKDRLEYYAWNNVAKAILEVYRKVLNK